MKPTVYIETTIISYLTARPSRDVTLHSHQLLTHAWWHNDQSYERFTSQLTLAEVSRGDAAAAQKRLDVLSGVRVLGSGEAVYPLAERLASVLQLPQRAATDAVHLAIAATNGMQFLLTWNCMHLANGNAADKIDEACYAFGTKSPRVFTPEQLMELL